MQLQYLIAILVVFIKRSKKNKSEKHKYKNSNIFNHNDSNVEKGNKNSMVDIDEKNRDIGQLVHNKIEINTSNIEIITDNIIYDSNIKIISPKNDQNIDSNTEAILDNIDNDNSDDDNNNSDNNNDIISRK